MNDHLGKQLGNYRLVRMLGQGGFADVYLGEHIYLKTLAAIKILQTRLAQDDLEVFLKEARTISNLVHPHIVRVLEFGVEGTTPYLVMDFAANGTLRQRHPKGIRLSPVNVVPYVKQVASALQYAHDKRLIHRDIKPENMLIGQNDEVLLSDFGIALVSQSSRYQSTQEVVGTIAYMAPEQFHGKAVAASDQYSLGIVIYEWLTGDRPFHGSFAEVASQHLLTPPIPLRVKIGEITPAIEEVVQRAIAKDPQQRFLRVEAFANAFELACQPTIHQLPFVTLPSNPPMPNYGTVPPGQFSSTSTGDVPRPSSPNYMPIQTGGESKSTFVKPAGQGSSPNYTGDLSGQYQQNSSSVSQPSKMPEQQKRGSSRRGVIFALAGVAGLVVVGSAATLFELSQKVSGNTALVATATSTSSDNSTSIVGTSPTAGSTDTSTSGSNSSASPTVDTNATANSNPIVVVTPGATVYTADWSNGMDGWAGSPDWKVLNGVLLNDGTNGNEIAGPTITPPYQLRSISDYGLEATIQVVSYNDNYGPHFGVALRGTIVSNNWQGYATGIGNLDAKNHYGVCNAQITTQDYNNQLTKIAFDPGSGKHTYRFEAKGNVLRFFIDNGNVLEVADNRYLTGSQLGLWCYQAQLSITSFKIITL